MIGGIEAAARESGWSLVTSPVRRDLRVWRRGRVEVTVEYTPRALVRASLVEAGAPAAGRFETAERPRVDLVLGWLGLPAEGPVEPIAPVECRACTRQLSDVERVLGVCHVCKVRGA